MGVTVHVTTEEAKSKNVVDAMLIAREIEEQGTCMNIVLLHSLLQL